MTEEQTRNPSRDRRDNQQNAKSQQRQASNKLAVDSATGSELRENRQERRLELMFAGPPPLNVREMVRAAGFRWLAAGQIWTKPLPDGATKQVRLEAERLFDEVRDLLRAENGIEGRDR